MAIVKAENARKDIPLVSIIAICYNHSEYAIETLNSILNQSYENIELIIIDSNSSDNSVEVIHDWIDQNKVECTFIKQIEPRNICQNLNEGLNIISGEYFQGLSCDDILLKSKVSKQVTLFQNSEKNIAFLFANASFIDNNSKTLLGRKNFIEHHSQKIEPDYDNLFDNLIKRNFIPAMSVLIRTKKVKQVGGYDERLNYEDFDMWLRLLKNGDKANYVNEVNCLYRIHDNNLHLSNDIDWIAQYYWVYKKHLDYPLAKSKIKNFISWAHQQGKFNNLMVIDYRKTLSTSNFEKLALRFRVPFKVYDKILIFFKKNSLN